MKKIIFILPILFLLSASALPVFAQTNSNNPGNPNFQLVPCAGVVAANNLPACDFNSLVTLAQNIINYLLYISIAVAAAAFAVAGFKYVTAGGNEGQIKQAHAIFTNVAVGLLIALSAWLLIYTILSALLGANLSQYSILGG